MKIHWYWVYVALVLTGVSATGGWLHLQDAMTLAVGVGVSMIFILAIVSIMRHAR